MQESCPRKIILPLYLFALLLMGLCHLAMTPAFEGVDEYAHYSSMRQIAGTGTIPLLGSSYVDKAYADYAGPRPYPYDRDATDTDMTYWKFFRHPELMAAYRAVYRDQAFTQPFSPSAMENWQAQHPPLYYALMAPVVNAVTRASFVTQIFILRLVSYLLALGGIGFGYAAAQKADGAQDRDAARVGFFLYPVVLPMLFPEFARLGNDSLCLFLLGLLAWLLALWRQDELNTKLSTAIGVTLGLGCLTKAFFLPFGAGLAAFLILRLRRDDAQATLRPQRLWSVICMVYPAALLGGAWYIYNATHLGVFVGGNDSAYINTHGGIWNGLRAHFSLHAFLMGLFSFFASFSWGGTWSAAYPSLWARIPVLFLTAWLLILYARDLRRKPATDFSWLFVWLFGFMSVGLLYHMFIGIAINGFAMTPGWYIHILMPFLAPALGAALCRLLRKQVYRQVTIALLLYTGAFQLMLLWEQFALFAGCAGKNHTGRYTFPGHDFCFDQFGAMTMHLNVLAMPWLAIAALAGCLICAAILACIQKSGRNFIE